MPDSGSVVDSDAAKTEDDVDLDAYFTQVYDQLRMLARRQMSGDSGSPTLQPTALVHEAYLRLVASGSALDVPGRRYFFGAASRSMRQILIDRARHSKSQKRGGDFERVTLADDLPMTVAKPTEVLAVDRLLKGLEARDQRMAKLIELRFFGGLTIAEAGEVLEVSERTVFRLWRRARAWLQLELDRDVTETTEP